MKKNYLILIVCLACVTYSQAQNRLFGERAIFTQYYLSPFLMHPGAVGQNDYSQVVGIYRNTWATFDGSPRSFAFGYEGPIGNRIGIGILGMSDSFAAFNTTKGALSLSYTITTANNKIGFGISGEYARHSLESSAVLNSLVDGSDRLIAERINGYSFFDLSLGVYGKYMDKITYGVTIPSVVSQRISGIEGSQDDELGFIVSVGYEMDLPNQDITLEPSVYVRQLRYAPLQIDLNLKADFLGEALTAGLSGSVGGENRLGFLIGTQQKNLGLHYSYNLSLNEFQTYSNGSHEIGVRFRLVPLDTRGK